MRQAANITPKTEHNPWTVSNIIGGIGGMALGRYVGINMLIPFVGTAFLWWLLNRKTAGAARAFVPACAIQGGHAAWMLVGLIATGGANYGLLDICLIAGGLVWLMSAPGLGPILLLAVYQAGVLLYNLNVLASFDVGTFMHRAMVMHVALRVAALAYLFVGWRTFIWQRRQSPAATGLEPMSVRVHGGMN